MDYEQWKKEAEAEAENILCTGDLFDADDPYDLQAEAKAWFDSGGSPKAFIREMFAEDIASQEHDAQMVAKYSDSENEDEDDLPWWETTRLDKIKDSI